MALYAVDNDDLISAWDAQTGQVYWCMDCFGPVKKRGGSGKVPHFFHVQSALGCRLYSKTEDHFLAQLSLQKLFGTQELSLEYPFPRVQRVADCCFHRERVVFEIQCSPILESEARLRIEDYRSAGHEIVWLLDDRRFNKKRIKEAERFLREQCCYFLSIDQKRSSIEIYDQFEVLIENARVQKGKKLPIDLKKGARFKPKVWDPDIFPEQITKYRGLRFTYNDRIHRALSYHVRTMSYWRKRELEEKKRKTHKIKAWIIKNIIEPYMQALRRLIKRL